MTRILLVDDSLLSLRLAGGLLEKNPNFEIEYAENGKEALEFVKRSPPDLVVTDLVMPEMDGLELVRVLRTSHPHIPVILMTAYGNETIAVEALEEGAASYVPKAQQAERLLETVKRVLARSFVDRVRAKLWERLDRINSSFRLENNPNLIPPLVDFVQQAMVGAGLSDTNGRVRVGVALEEALLNGMYHGNLEITSDELAEARIHPESGYLTQLVQGRLSNPQIRRRKVVVDVHISSIGGARFIIRDEGSGFDVAAASVGGEEESFERGRNRGILLMRKLMDEVIFNDRGNQVTLFKRRDCKSEPLATPMSD